jgi:heme-degrading monooxygenase HmoA
VIRSVLILRAAAGQASALEELYAERGVLERAREFRGCRDALLLRSVDGSSAPYPVTHVVTADWDTAEDYQRWVEDPWRVALSQQLVTLLDTDPDGPVVGGLFELVQPR